MQKDYILKDGVLYHHGIKGQKWGERRFQNEDGSLTPEGRERYGYGEVIRKTVSSGLKKIVRKTIDNKVKDSRIQMQKDRMKQDPLYRRKIERENELVEMKRRRKEKDPFGLKGKINDLGKTDKELEREQFDRREALKQAKQEYRNSEEYKQAKDKAKKIAIAGAAVVVTALATYGAYKYVEATKEKAYKVSYRKGSEAASRIMADVGMKNSMNYETFSRAFKGFGDNIRKTSENNSKNFITSMRYLKGKGGQQSVAELTRQGINTINVGPNSKYIDKAIDLYRNGINEDYIFGKKR